MLDIVAEKLFDNPLAKRVTLHKCSTECLELANTIRADFILAYYMVHELANQKRFFNEIYSLLSAGGTVLIVEPPFHVSKKSFLKMQETAALSGFFVKSKPKRKGGRSLLLTK